MKGIGLIRVIVIIAVILFILLIGSRMITGIVSGLEPTYSQLDVQKECSNFKTQDNCLLSEINKYEKLSIYCDQETYTDLGANGLQKCVEDACQCPTKV